MDEERRRATAQGVDHRRANGHTQKLRTTTAGLRSGAGVFRKAAAGCGLGCAGKALLPGSCDRVQNPVLTVQGWRPWVLPGGHPEATSASSPGGHPQSSVPWASLTWPPASSRPVTGRKQDPSKTGASVLHNNYIMSSRMSHTFTIVYPLEVSQESHPHSAREGYGGQEHKRMGPVGAIVKPHTAHGFSFVLVKT